MSMTSKSFAPRVDILPPAQGALWRELAKAIPASFTLYGGTALALQLGHRQSLIAVDRIGSSL